MALTVVTEYSRDQHISYKELPASPLGLKGCLVLASAIKLLFLMINKKEILNNKIKSNL